MQHFLFNDEMVPASQQPLLKSLLGCKTFSTSDRLLGYSKGRGITWFLNTQAELGVNAVLRHYRRGGLFGKLIKDRYFFAGLEQTRAVQEFRLLQQLHQWQIPVPRPLACLVEQQFGTYRADILLEKIEGTQDLSQCLQKSPLTAEQYQQIGRLIRQLHQHQVHHSDLNIHNILWQLETNKFWLIDFDKCQIQTGDSWKQSNLDRLLRSFQKEQQRLNIHFSQMDWQALVAGYRH